MVLVATAAPAAADTIAYVGSDGNVWLARPDGSEARRLTSDAGAPLSGEATKRYTGPAQADDGTVVTAASDRFTYVLNPDGTTKAGPWTAPVNRTSTTPVTIDIQPTGGLVTYWHIFQADLSSSARARVAFVDSNGPTLSQCTLANCYDNYVAPRWVPGANVVAMVRADGAQIDVQSGGGATGWLGIDPTKTSIEGFDISRTGYRALLNARDKTNGDFELMVWDNRTAPPDATQGVFVCGLDNFGAGESFPRWSPDGTKITWSDAQGVWTSPAPVSDGSPEQTCALSPRLIVPGGRSPDWSAAALPATPGPRSGETSDDVTTPGTTTADRSPPKLGGVRPRRQKLRTVLRRGLRVTLRSDEPGTATVWALRGRTAVAKGKRRFAGGRTTVVARFSRKAKKKLRRARNVSLKVNVAVVDAAGNRARRTVKVRLAR